MPAEALYKYLSPSRIDVLQGLRIRFTQASALNDPFESLPGATLERREWYMHYFQCRIDDDIQRLGITERGVRRKFAQQQIRKRFGTFLQCYTDKKWLAEYSESVKHMADHVDGCLSLSATCTNILMWSHYAVNHTGYVLGFHSGHQYFGDSITQVTYSSLRPKVNPFEHRHSAEIFYTKSADWSYEQEYRKFKSFVDPLKLPNGNNLSPFVNAAGQAKANESVMLVPYPKESIRCVILGWKSAPELRHSIVDALNQHGLATIPIFRAQPSLTEYKMELLQS